MALKIISGLARNIQLDTPPDRSMRPTAGRAREALFSSLGDLSGKRIADIFAGSGAVGLESVSRGAAAAVLVEANPRHVQYIEQNIAKLRRAGVTAPVEVMRRKVFAGTLMAVGHCDIWFFDPPYAESGIFLRDLLASDAILQLWQDALLIWEMPDTTEARAIFQQIPDLHNKLDCQIRNLGGTDFLWGRVRR